MIRRFSYGLTCAFVFSSLASATVLTLGTSDSPSGFSSAGWTLLASTGAQALSSLTFTASATAWVYSDTNNSFCAGCLDFVYEVTRISGTDPVERITAGSFASFGTDVGFVTGSAGVTPVSIDRSLNGGVIGFNYPTASSLTGVQSTQILVIETNATSFTAGLMAAIDSQSANGVSFQPSSVPEPASFAMVGSGLAMFGAFRFRRRPWQESLSHANVITAPSTVRSATSCTASRVRSRG
jgi:hypothetical protein